jgi:transposase
MSEALSGRGVRAARTQAAHPAGSEVLKQENKPLRAQLARAERAHGLFLLGHLSYPFYP